MAFMAAAAPIAGIVGAGISAIGTIEGGQATSNAAAYKAQVAKNNAIIADQNAQYSSNAGLASAAASSLKGAAAGGKVKATQAASGIDVNTGSAVNVQASERETNVLNSETVLNNADLQSYGYRAAALAMRPRQAWKNRKPLKPRSARTSLPPAICCPAHRAWELSGIPAPINRTRL
jgi:hypothetical protein